MLVVTPVPWFWAFFFHFIPCCFFQQSYIYVALMYPDVNHISVYTVMGHRCPNEFQASKGSIPLQLIGMRLIRDLENQEATVRWS